MSILAEDLDRISHAVRAAEDKTSGEIVCVLAQSSTGYTALPVAMAAVAALALPWLLVALTSMTVYRILSLQVATFVVLSVLLCLPRVRVALLPRKARRRLAYRFAMEQFTTRGHCAKKGSLRDLDLRFAGGALRPDYCGRWNFCSRSPISMAGGC